MRRTESILSSDTEFGFIDSSVPAEKILNPRLISNASGETMLQAIRNELSTAESFVFSVAFITPGGLGALKEALLGFKGTGTIITSDYQDFNEPRMFTELLELEGVQSFVFSHRPHHAKGYIFRRADHVTSIVGSANLTRNALMDNSEWNLQFSTHHDGDISDQLNRAIDSHIDEAEPLTHAWIAEYARRRKPVPPRFDPESLTSLQYDEPSGPVKPNAMQFKALERLQGVIDKGEDKALIISATGTGKTILAALAVQTFNPQRVLFVVHREQILKKAAVEFQKVFQCEARDIGFFVGAQRELGRRFVFSTVQSLSRPENLAWLSPREFDYIVVDEVHRSGADSYRRVINHFRPDFLLGLTATPERTDGFDIYELFDHNVPFEIRLGEALDSRMLTPFDYYGVSDYQSARQPAPDEDSDLEDLLIPERVSYISETLQRYGFAGDVKGLFFCSRNDEAARLSAELNGRTIHGRPLRTVALSGEDSIARREEIVAQLEAGELDYILTVDIFNEGIDIPSLNQIVMLRATQSAIIFTQQLGRGLRLARGKNSTRIIDFIGNYSNNYLIPIALTGDRSGVKESVKESIRKTRNSHFAGLSTISFDEVATARILESLEKATLLDKRKAKEAIQTLHQRFGGIPRLVDFEYQESVDPSLLASRWGNYWSLLHSLNFVEQPPNPLEKGFLDMLHGQILNGKRPQEALVLRELLAHGTASTEDISALLAGAGHASDANALQSVRNVLDLSFFTAPQQKSYGGVPLVVVDHQGKWALSDEFRELYFSYHRSTRFNPMSFRDHIDDFIDTTLVINSRRYKGSGTLKVGKTYTRRDACRLLNWASNQEGTVFGYKTDLSTKTCPVFVTYHKDSEVEVSVNYGDEFLDESTLHWFSRNRRTLKSKELQPLLNNDVEIHLFVMREDSDGGDFYYLGQARSTNAVQTSMIGPSGSKLDVVTTDLRLHVPVEGDLLAQITAPKTRASK